MLWPWERSSHSPNRVLQFKLNLTVLSKAQAGEGPLCLLLYTRLILFLVTKYFGADI